MKTGKRQWHKEARKFFREINQEYEFSLDEMQVLNGACEQLSLYWKAAETIHSEGLIVQGPNGMMRKHPSAEIMKNSWAAFLAGCRLLGVCQPHDEKRSVGRPGSGI